MSIEGKWIALAEDGSVIESAESLAELERLLAERHGFKEEALPAIRHVPQNGSASFLL